MTYFLRLLNHMASGDQRTRFMGHFYGAFTSLKAPEAIHYNCMDYKTIHIRLD